MSHRKVPLETVRHLQFSFSHEEVLLNPEDRAERDHALRSAMALSNNEHEEIGLIVKLANGELVEIVSNLIDYESDLVEVRGGSAIPLQSILRVEL